MKRLAIFSSFVLLSLATYAQQENGIAVTIDSLTAKWDKEALILKTYDGMRDYCKSQPHRVQLIDLVKEIHHYDSVLLTTVTAKYDANQDTEAKETLKDIKKLETEYTTKGFLKFIHTECSAFNTIEKNYGLAKGKPYEKEKAKMEKELASYVDEITEQIDIIDEHIHHLKAL